jgi:predicted nuclease of predicted toxin-antitoxin system
MSATDLEVWNACQAEELIVITDNRNLDSEDSLEATIRRNNTPESLPVFTIADMNQFRTNNTYVEHVVEALYDYLMRIDDIRGTGRLYLP